MADITPERIAELRSMIKDAPRGIPAVIDIEGMHDSRVVVNGRVVVLSSCLDEPASHHCAALAATGWSDLPVLLDEVERLRAEAVELQALPTHAWASELDARCQALVAECDRNRMEVAAAMAERGRYHDALVARHGGEPVALLAELDTARAQIEVMTERMARIEQRLKRLAQWQPVPLSNPLTDSPLVVDHNDMLTAIKDVFKIATGVQP